MENCCCRDPNLPESCLPKSDSDDRGSSFCGRNPQLRPAEPSEFNIVCSEYSLAILPEQVSPEEELVLQIEQVTNFPGYEQGMEGDVGENLKGPYAGGDIAVYHLTSESKRKALKRMKEKTLSPACLPQKEYKSEKGLFAGWLDHEPFYRVGTGDIQALEEEYLTVKRVQVRSNKVAFLHGSFRLKRLIAKIQIG